MFDQKNYKKWLANLNPGDKVIVHSRRTLGGDKKSICEVVKITKTEIQVKHEKYESVTKFRRDSGEEKKLRTRWDIGDVLEEPTEENIAQMKLERIRAATHFLLYELSKTPRSVFEKMSLEKSREVKELLLKAKELLV